jgi:uncharacterized phage-like protein YoqJ
MGGQAVIPPRPPDRLNWTIASVTAHREVTVEDTRIIHEAVRGLVYEDGLDAIYFGGARGGDTVALQAAIYFRANRPRPWLTVVVPETLLKQPEETRYWTKRADEVIELRNPLTQPKSYAIRNQYLVDISTFLVAFYNGDKRSGTGMTVGMAESVGLAVRKFQIEGRRAA